MFALLVILTAGAAPGLFWMWYVYKKDVYEPEPLSLVTKAFFYGALSTIPALVLEIMLGFDGIVSLIVVAPVVEECIKCSVIVFFFLKNKEVNEPLDILIYATAVALGFATIENLGYLLTAAVQGTLPQVAFLRALLSVPGHFLFSTIWALGLALQFVNKTSRRPALSLYLGASILAHAAFNTIAVFTPFGGLFFILIMALLWLRFHRSVRLLLGISPFKTKGKSKA
jgi:RsiW-degrading membrane proteinase PrsW (M82 family)